MAWSTEVERGFQAQEPPIKRICTTGPGEEDWNRAVNSIYVGEQVVPKQWSWENNIAETAAHLP